MLDVGWSELLLIGVVALIVVGPRDLPRLFHALGRITSRARSMAREFSSAMEDAAKASGLEDATKELRDLKKMTSPRATGLDALGRAAERFEKWDPLEPVRNQSGAKTAVPDPAAPPPAAAAGAAAPAATPATAPPASPAANSPRPVPEAVARASADSGAPATEQRPGARRLHAVRRGDRS